MPCSRVPRGPSCQLLIEGIEIGSLSTFSAQVSTFDQTHPGGRRMLLSRGYRMTTLKSLFNKLKSIATVSLLIVSAALLAPTARLAAGGSCGSLGQCTGAQWQCWNGSSGPGECMGSCPFQLPECQYGADSCCETIFGMASCAGDSPDCYCPLGSNWEIQSNPCAG
jgi:hypothetical protein